MSALTDTKTRTGLADLPLAARRRIWGWWAFDWASQNPISRSALPSSFGPYFASVATESFMASGLTEQVADARAQSLWSLGQTVSGIFIALLAPILGAFADNTGRRMPWIVLFSIFYMAGAASLWFMLPDGSFLVGALIAFGIGLIGVEFTTIFTQLDAPGTGRRKRHRAAVGHGFRVGLRGRGARAVRDADLLRRRREWADLCRDGTGTGPRPGHARGNPLRRAARGAFGTPPS